MTECRPTKKAEIRAAREMRAAHVPYRLIEIRLRRSKSWILAHARDVPGAVRTGKEPDKEAKVAAITMRKNGVRHEEIAGRLEIKLYWVQKWCRGLKPYPDKTRPARAVQMRNEDMSNAQIANALGYKNARTVSAVLVAERRRQKEHPR